MCALSLIVLFHIYSRTAVAKAKCDGDGNNSGNGNGNIKAGINIPSKQPTKQPFIFSLSSLFLSLNE